MAKFIKSLFEVASHNFSSLFLAFLAESIKAVKMELINTINEITKSKYSNYEIGIRDIPL